jgi:hypothetical protein
MKLLKCFSGETLEKRFVLLKLRANFIPIIGVIIGIGILPILYGATMAVLQSLSPPPPDKMQARIIMALPLVFMFVFGGFAAGLVLYWVWSNVLTFIQQYLEDFNAIIKNVLDPSAPKDEKDPPEDEEKADTNKVDLAPITDGLAKLNDAFKALSESVTAQAQRLGRVEKQFGLPNSAPPPEPVTKSQPEEVGWPMDLNKPMDRENVDKAVSFHEP